MKRQILYSVFNFINLEFSTVVETIVEAILIFVCFFFVLRQIAILFYLFCFYKSARVYPKFGLHVGPTALSFDVILWKRRFSNTLFSFYKSKIRIKGKSILLGAQIGSAFNEGLVLARVSLFYTQRN